MWYITNSDYYNEVRKFYKVWLRAKFSLKLMNYIILGYALLNLTIEVNNLRKNGSLLNTANFFIAKC